MLDGVGRFPSVGTGSQYGLAQPTPVAPAPTPQTAPVRTEPLPSDFGAVLGQMTLEAISTLRSSEQTAVAGVRGQATAQQVVEAVMDAEQTLQTAIAIRDKVVASYLEVSRMAI
ncbi:flagellar hook-basal body protein FliE [Hyphomicrobium nitrativorans NL23]|uniref:Flagellar hook-basal body complex protein FliE n=1 Tax=Hyphomicrobium nitrativorans NL23 TaxID=1029756 RepID=V5SB97_9HYPH|nr:flagellar hook-basal body complex protein FliE [Hyphomicrobium nitrativorans]AHB47767.1 flagellar hook-basal body protein FliE [Hyphomicrobium nitrativorans NL23]